MNSRAPISAFDNPSRASRATCPSWVVSSSRVSTVRFPTRSPVASNSRSARAGERFGAHAREHLERGAQLVASVPPTALAPKPLAVDEMGARKVYAHAGASEPVDRLAIQALGGLAVAEQRARTCLDAQRPVGAGGARRLRDPLKRESRRAGSLRPGPRPRSPRPWAAASHPGRRIALPGGEAPRQPRIGPVRCRAPPSPTPHRPARIPSPRAAASLTVVSKQLAETSASLPRRAASQQRAVRRSRNPSCLADGLDLVNL